MKGNHQNSVLIARRPNLSKTQPSQAELAWRCAGYLTLTIEEDTRSERERRKGQAERVSGKERRAGEERSERGAGEGGVCRVLGAHPLRSTHDTPSHVTHPHWAAIGPTIPWPGTRNSYPRGPGEGRRAKGER